MERQTLRVTWKIIRRAGHGRTKHTYCSYIAENGKHKHRLKTTEGTKLFEILRDNIISKTDRYAFKVLVDGVYHKGELQYVTNFRVL